MNSYVIFKEIDILGEENELDKVRKSIKTFRGK